MYFLPFLFGIGTLAHYVNKHFKDISKGPLKMSMRQLAVLAFLSVSTVLLDYSAIVSYSSMQTSQNIQGLEYPIPFFLIFKLALTPIMTHIFSCLILNRYFVKKTFFHFLLALVGILVYEFTVFDNTGASYSDFVTLMGRLKLVLPTIYTFTL